MRNNDFSSRLQFSSFPVTCCRFRSKNRPFTQERRLKPFEAPFYIPLPSQIHTAADLLVDREISFSVFQLDIQAEVMDRSGIMPFSDIRRADFFLDRIYIPLSACKLDICLFDPFCGFARVFSFPSAAVPDAVFRPLGIAGPPSYHFPPYFGDSVFIIAEIGIKRQSNSQQRLEANFYPWKMMLFEEEVHDGTR